MGVATGVRYDTRVIAVGEQVEAFRGEGMLVLFADGAPEELHDFCALHRPAAEPSGAVTAGDVVDIDGHELVVTAVGERANENLAHLGHVSLKANGLDVAELPGDICVTGELPSLAVGSVVRITAPDPKPEADMAYRERLLEREQSVGRPVRIGLAGAGQMGAGYVAQVARIDGMEIGAIADVDRARAEAAYERAGLTADGARFAILDDARRLADADVDVVVDATGVPEVGAQLSVAALRAGRHVALLNVECDVTVGYLLAALARHHGPVYTVCRGDEPAEAKRLVDFARDLAFEVVCAGKGKNNPMDPTATPDTLRDEAESKRMNPKMLCSFVDGSKAMIEMVSLANATDLQVSKRGFHGPETTVEGLAQVYRLERDGGILDRAGVVDYCTGPVAPGVFVIVHTDDPVVHEEMSYLKMGPGPYFTLYRPFHLASIEAPLSVGEAILDRAASIAPVAWNAEVGAAAKRDLHPGDQLDGIGGTTVYGMSERADVFAQQGLLPLGLIGGATVTRPVRQGELLTYDDVRFEGPSMIRALRELQDRQVAEAWSDADVAQAVEAIVDTVATR